METLNELYTSITKLWSTPGQCVLGHLTYVPQTLYGGLDSRRAPPREDRLEGLQGQYTWSWYVSINFIKVVRSLTIISSIQIFACRCHFENVFSLEGVVASSSFGMLNQRRRTTQPNHARRERQHHQTHHQSR